MPAYRPRRPNRYRRIRARPLPYVVNPPTPYLIANSGQVSGSTVYNVPIIAATKPGDGITVLVGAGGTAAPAVASVTDSQGQKYILQQQTSTSPILVEATAPGSIALSTADTLIVTFASAATGGVSVLACATPGMRTVDVNVTPATGSSATPAVTGTPTSASEMALACLVYANAAGTGLVRPPFPQLGQAHPSGGAWATLAYSYAPASGVGLTATSDITSASWRATMLSLKPVAPWYMSNASFIHLMFLQDPTTTAQFFNTPTAYAISNNPAATGIQDSFTCTPILKYTSYAQLQADITGGAITGGFTWLMYDNEYEDDGAGGNAWPTPMAEANDPWTYMANFVSLAHANGFKVMCAPGRDLGNNATSVNPLTGGESLDAWYIRTNIAGTAAAAGADVVHVQTQADEAVLSDFLALWNPTLGQSAQGSAVSQVSSGLSTSRGTYTDMANAAMAVASTTWGYWLNTVNAEITEAVQFLQVMAGLTPTGSTSVAGVTAAVTITAAAGTASVSVVGVTAQVTEVAPAGTTAVAVTGQTAAVSIAGRAGTPTVSMTGVTAAVAIAAPAGAPVIAVAGQTAAVSVAGRAGTPTVVLTGVTAAVTESAPAGTPSIAAVGTTAQVAVTGLAGTPIVTVIGTTAQVTAAAPAGVPAVSVVGVTAQVNVAAPAGTVSAGTPTTTVTGVTAQVTVAAPAGSSSAAVAGATAAVTVSAPAGVPSVSAVGVTASVSVAAQAGTATVSAAGTTAAVAVAGIAGTPSVSVIGATAAVVVSAPAGSVSTVPVTTVNGQTAQVTVAGPSGSPAVAVSGSVASVGVAAPSGAVGASVAGATASVAASAPAGTPKVAPVGTTAQAALAAVPGTSAVSVVGVTAQVIVSAPAGTVTAFVPQTSVTGVTARVGITAQAGLVITNSVDITKNFNDAAVASVFDRIVSHALGSARFDAVNSHEPKNAPGVGLYAAAWIDAIDPIRASGLSATSGRVVINLRIYSSFTGQPFDESDVIVGSAAAQIIRDLSGDFEFSQAANVRNIDIYGTYGVALASQAGYVEIDKHTFRVATVRIPIIINDMFAQFTPISVGTMSQPDGFNDAAVAFVFDRIISYAMASGRFDAVNSHEPKNAPGNGVSCSIWMQRIAPSRASGLVSTSGVVTVQARVYSNFVQQPFDAIDPNVTAAAAALMSALSADFEFGGDSDTRNVDLLGSSGEALGAQAGYVEIDKRMFRVMTVNIPIIMNDMFVQSA